MARMLPPEVLEGTQSDAERRMFWKIRDDLSGEWTALHSLGIARHEKKPWAELDFVLIGQKGIFAIEVKGGRIGRREGQWIFVDRHGHSSEKREGPFQQVAGASAALGRFLASRFLQYRDTIHGYGVAMPDIVFELDGPDIEKEVLYDHRDESQSLEVYVRRLADYWTKRLETARGHSLRLLKGSECRQLVELLRGDFDLRPSLRTRVGLVKDELLRLTEEQYRVLDALAENERLIVSGGAGTGKTLLAIEEARRQANAGRRVFYCCFNRRLGSFAAAAVSDRSLITARHLHGWIAEIVTKAGLIHRLPKVPEPDLFRSVYPELCTEVMLGSTDFPYFDVLILDEAQDLLLLSYCDVFDLLLNGGLARGTWRAFFDPNQNLFDALRPDGIERLVATRPAQFRLTVNCRNTAPIAVNTALLSGIDSIETLVVEGPEVEIHWCRHDVPQSHEVSRYVSRLLSEGLKPNQIILLSGKRLGSGSLARGLEDVPYPVRELSENPLADLKENVIRHSTISGFKGLEADVVVVFDIDNLRSPEARSALYVAGSRATALLALFLSERVRADYDQMAKEFGQRLRGLGKLIDMRKSTKSDLPVSD